MAVLAARPFETRTPAVPTSRRSYLPKAYLPTLPPPTAKVTAEEKPVIETRKVVPFVYDESGLKTPERKPVAIKTPAPTEHFPTWEELHGPRSGKGPSRAQKKAAKFEKVVSRRRMELHERRLKLHEEAPTKLEYSIRTQVNITVLDSGPLADLKLRNAIDGAKSLSDLGRVERVISACETISRQLFAKKDK